MSLRGVVTWSPPASPSWPCSLQPQPNQPPAQRAHALGALAALSYADANSAAMWADRECRQRVLDAAAPPAAPAFVVRPDAREGCALSLIHI